MIEKLRGPVGKDKRERSLEVLETGRRMWNHYWNQIYIMFVSSYLKEYEGGGVEDWIQEERRMIPTWHEDSGLADGHVILRYWIED